MKRNTIWLAVSLAALGAGTAAAQNYPSAGYRVDPRAPNAQSHTVRCESIDSRQASCLIARGSDVRIVNQISRQACVRGRNWDFNDTRITVADGCRADFLVTGDARWNDDRRDDRYGEDRDYRYGDDRDDRYGDDRYGDNRYGDGRYGADRYGNRSGHTIHCASRSRGRVRTQCGDHAGNYTIVGRSANCVEGRTWGDAQRGVWVSGKCSANFRLTSGYEGDRDWRGDRDDDRRHDAFARNLRCDSNGNWRTYCGDVREGPYTLRDTGNRYCVKGSTWGNDARGLWVSGQCRAEFVRTNRDDDGRPDMHPYGAGVVRPQYE